MPKLGAALPHLAPSTEALQDGLPLPPALTPSPVNRARAIRVSVLLLTFLVLSLLGSWALVRVSLRFPATPFRISAGYGGGHGGHGGQGELDMVVMDSRFTSNCTFASPPSPRVTLQGHYSCNRGPKVSLGQMCDFQKDCPSGDDEESLCSEYASNGSVALWECRSVRMWEWGSVQDIRQSDTTSQLTN
ncbi:apical endosomal glycoprotein [Amia ocellicauda]|uniref:apical endosomal glycoprotein n=1 Tax=Amia ocellicauda TaxID=2972642 RepID=UPI0034648314